MKKLFVLTVLFFAFSVQIVNAADHFCCALETQTEYSSTDFSSEDSSQHDCENCILCSHCQTVLMENYNIVFVDSAVLSIFSARENLYSSCHIAKYPKPPCA
jgi:hypothetical protein